MNRCTWPDFCRACTPWVLVLMLLVSLVPAVSRAMGVAAVTPGAGLEAGTSRAGWVEVCGAGGVRWVQLDPTASVGQPGNPDVPLPPMGHPSDLDHCALCGLALDRCLTSSQHAWAAPELASAVFIPSRPAPLQAWPHARPRATGPPLLF